jgi:hypothetical protein
VPAHATARQPDNYTCRDGRHVRMVEPASVGCRRSSMAADQADSTASKTMTAGAASRANQLEWGSKESIAAHGRRTGLFAAICAGHRTELERHLSTRNCPARACLYQGSGIDNAACLQTTVLHARERSTSARRVGQQGGRWYDKIPFRSGPALHVFIWVTPGADQAAHRAGARSLPILCSILQSSPWSGNRSNGPDTTPHLRVLPGKRRVGY